MIAKWRYDRQCFIIFVEKNPEQEELFGNGEYRVIFKLWGKALG